MCKSFVFFFLLFVGCTSNSSIIDTGKYYQQHSDYKSLTKVVALMPVGVDTSYVKSILGEAINMGFEYRYTVDSTSPNGCSVGAVFHFGNKGIIDTSWVGEICE